MPHSKLVRLDDNFTLTATVNENEIGPLIFYDQSGSARLSTGATASGRFGSDLFRQDSGSDLNGQLEQQHFVIFDSDLGSNASFEIAVGPNMYHPGGDKIASKHLKFNPSGFQSDGNRRNEPSQQQRATVSSGGYGFSSSSLLAFNHEPFDFDTLNVEPEFDPVTGVASKVVKFNVRKSLTIKEIFGKLKKLLKRFFQNLGS